jgi:hypothetical protein
MALSRRAIGLRERISQFACSGSFSWCDLRNFQQPRQISLGILQGAQCFDDFWIDPLS